MNERSPETTTRPVLAQLLRLAVRLDQKTIVASFRCADGSMHEIEVSAECAAHALPKFTSGIGQLLRLMPADSAPRSAPMAVGGVQVSLDVAGRAALVLEVGGGLELALQLDSDTEIRALIEQLVMLLNANAARAAPN